jgi:cell division protein FtsB
MRLPVIILVLSIAATAHATDSGFGHLSGFAVDSSNKEKQAAEADSLRAERQALNAEFERLRQRYAELQRRSKEFHSRWREVHPCVGDCLLPGEVPGVLMRGQ